MARRFNPLSKMVSLICFLSVFCGACSDANQDQTSLKVTNGITISDASLPEVVKLSLRDARDRGFGCTGTFVSDSQVLTAAHCVADLASASVKVDGERIYGESFKKHPNYDSATKEEKARYDLAIISFSKGSSSHVREISSVPPEKDQKIAIIGYGNTIVQDYIDYRISPTGEVESSGLRTYGGDGKKRYGYNTLDKRENGELIFVGEFKAVSGKAGENSAAAQGDSGGPMLAKGSDGEWKLVGVTSMGRASIDEERKTERKNSDGSVEGRIYLDHVETVYVDLLSASSQEFLEDNLH